MVFSKQDKVLIIGDLHFPYHNKKAYRWAMGLVKDYKPTRIVQIGDLYDFYWFSKYPKRFIGFGPEEEIKKGLDQAEDFWWQLSKSAPKAEKLQLLGNHDDRPMKRVLEKLPELQTLINVSALYEFEGVKTILDSRDQQEIRVNGKRVLFQHGHLSGLGRHMNYNQMRVVVGHSHTGGVLYRGLEREIHWELNVGYLGDASAGPLQYGPQRRKTWTLGVGMIDAFGPRFVPYSG